MRKRSVVATGAILMAMMGGLSGAGSASAASTATQGVTATTVRVGFPYVDFAAVAKVGVSINNGSIPDATNALIANINAHGGINGRKIVPFLVAVDPTSPVPGATTCTQMTEDDKVFVAVGPLMPDCYLSHGVPTVAAILQGVATSGPAPNFGLAPPASAYDPVQLGVFAKLGTFKGKKVGVFAGNSVDARELSIVEASLKKLHVDVVQTATDSAPQNDLVALDQQVAVITQRFQGAGVNEVVAVGFGSAIWPEALSANQSTYNPPFVATNPGDLSGYTSGNNNPTYIKNVVVSSPAQPVYQTWISPATQKCVQIIRKAYPSDVITAPPKIPVHSSNTPYIAPEAACTDLTLLTDILKAAGKNLTVSSFVRGGESLRNILLPSSKSPVSFAPGRPYALGPVYLGHFDLTSKTIEYSNTPAN
jgi:hypothetical protein